MAKNLCGVVVEHLFRNSGKILIFLKLKFGYEKQEDLICQEGDSKDFPRQSLTH